MNILTQLKGKTFVSHPFAGLNADDGLIDMLDIPVFTNRILTKLNEAYEVFGLHVDYSGCKVWGCAWEGEPQINVWGSEKPRTVEVTIHRLAGFKTKTQIKSGRKYSGSLTIQEMEPGAVSGSCAPARGTTKVLL